MMKKYVSKLIIVLILLSSTNILVAQTTRFWSGGSSSSDNIDQGTNWFNGNPSSGDNLYFDNTCGSCRFFPFSNYGPGSFFGDLIAFNGAGSIRFRGDNSYFFKIENNNSPDLLEIENNTVGSRIGSNLEINPVGTGGISFIGSFITIDNSGGAKQILVYGDNALNIDADIQDTNGTGGSFNIINNATVTLNGNNTYSGATTVNGGMLILKGNLTNSDITVKSGATLEVDGNLTVKSITVEAGGYIQVNTGNTLTITNDITLESTSDSYSSLISDGTITGTVNYNRHVNNAAGTGSSTTANDLISPPLSGMTFGALRMANGNILSGTVGGTPPTFYLFGHFDNSSVNDYVLYEETADDAIVLDTGVGYRTGSTDGGTYTFTGGVETGTVTESISTPSGGSIWNLIGNPYPSYITLAEFLSINNGEFEGSSAGVYGYDGAASDGWTIWNGIYLLSNPNAVIAPGQGFFVASKSGGGSVNFNPNMRTTGTADDFIPLRESSVVSNIKLDISTATDNFTTDIYFTEFTTLGLDPGYDASLFGGSAPGFSIYSHLVEDNDGIPFAIQALGEMDYGNTTVALGINASQGEQLTFCMPTNTLPATVSVFLEDNVANTSTLLNSNDYVITPGTNLSGTGRFYLNFMDSALSIPQTIFDGLAIYENFTNRTIVISGELTEDIVANVYDIQGRLVTSKALNSNERLNTINVNALQTGVYVVQLSNGNQIRTEKIIIN